MTFGEQFHVIIDKPADPWGTTVNVDQWFKSTEDNLRKVGNVKTGKMLLQAILDSGFSIIMQPLLWEECNAHGAGAQGFTNQAVKGVVKFDATVFEKGSHCFKTRLAEKYNRGGKADEVLFHEMVHALRGGMQLTGAKIVIDREPVSGGLWRYSTGEEFIAVVLTNIYISDETNKGSSGLRGGHRGKMPLEKYFAHSLCFFASSTQILPQLEKFRSEHTKLFDNIAKVNAPFNPIKMLAENPKAVERITKAKATIAHEAGAEKHQKWLEDKRLAEARAAIAAAKTQSAKDLEAAIGSVLNASPQQMADELGRLGNFALDTLKKWH